MNQEAYVHMVLKILTLNIGFLKQKQTVNFQWEPNLKILLPKKFKCRFVHECLNKLFVVVVVVVVV